MLLREEQPAQHCLPVVLIHWLPGGEYAENYVSAWIDFNNDGVFSSTEMIASGIYMEEAIRL